MVPPHICSTSSLRSGYPWVHGYPLGNTFGATPSAPRGATVTNPCDAALILASWECFGRWELLNAWDHGGVDTGILYRQI